MDYQEADHGVSITGVQDYLSDLELGAFTDIKNALINTTDVVAAIHNGWTGTSADIFEKNIIKAGNDMADKISELETMLRTEVEGIQSEILDMDANLVEEE